MRSFLIAALFAATTITPAMAQDGERNARGEAMRERLGNFARHLPREDGGERSRGGRVQQQAQPAPQVAPPSVMRSESAERRGGGGEWNRGNSNEGNWRGRQNNPNPAVSNEQGRNWGGRNWEGRNRGENHADRRVDNRDRRDESRGQNDWRNRGVTTNPPVTTNRWPHNRVDEVRRDRQGDYERRDRNGSHNRNRGWNQQRQGYDNRHHGNQRHSWNYNWRQNNRYDWNSHRSRYNDYYRMPRYANPYGYGYGYRQFGIGSYLDGLFFSSRYWIRDPFQYRLPEPPYGYRWIRYYDDVLLVDMRHGEVVDVIRNFFW